MKLNKLANNAHVLVMDNHYYLFSYETHIATYSDDLTITSDWEEQSQTTKKHLYAFIREYTPFDACSSRDVNNLIKEGYIGLDC